MICGILIKQKSDIMVVDDVVGISHSALNFSYNVLPNILKFGESDSSMYANIPEVTPMSWDPRVRILNVLKQEYKALQEMIPTSTTRKV